MESIYYVLPLPASAPPRGPTKAKGLIYLSHKWDIFRRGAQEMSGSKDGGAGCDPDGWTVEDSGGIRKAHLLTRPPPAIKRKTVITNCVPRDNGLHYTNYAQ